MSPRPDAIRGCTITGTGMYVPERIMTNHDLEQLVDTSDEWIVSRTGIRERRIAAPDEAASDLALIACRRALEMAKVRPEEVQHIVFASTTPDRVLPAAGCTLQQKLGATRAAAYDVIAACSGFVFGMSLARGLIGSGVADTVLVVGTEVLSRILDYTDRNTCVLFGDGAGAAVFRPCAAGEGILAIDVHSDGELGEVLEVPSGISRNPPTEQTVAGREHFIRMQGKKLFPFAVRSMEESLRLCLDASGLTPDDLDLVIPHQANLRIIDAVTERMALPAGKVYINIDRVGNTSAASIPIALDECVRGGRLKPGDNVGFAAFGGGATWGGAVMKWTLPSPLASEGAAAAGVAARGGA